MEKGNFSAAAGILEWGDMMSKHNKQKQERQMEDLRLSPQYRLCNKFDATSIAEFRVADPGEMGVRVVDNCAEEHIM